MIRLSKMFVSWILSNKGTHRRRRRLAHPRSRSALIEMLEIRSLMSGVSVGMAGVMTSRQLRKIVDKGHRAHTRQTR